MKTLSRTQNSYDHRLKKLVFDTGDIQLALELGVPRSTALGWLHSSKSKVISIDVLEAERKELELEVLKLRQTVVKLRAILRIFIVILRVSEFSLSKTRIPSGDKKSKILNSIELSQKAISLKCILRILDISFSRYHAWKRSLKDCDLEDQSSCPKSSPHQITIEEKLTIKELVTSPEYRHVPTGTLSLLAQRQGKVFASKSTWLRLVRENDWRRPRKRIHPLKSKVGIRASKPNEIWHLDVTQIKLLNGTKVYLHAVIDNYSRKILSWKISNQLKADTTVTILTEAAQHFTQEADHPTLLVDGGTENYNYKVDEFIDSGLFNRILAQTEISFSNSMIESWWRSLKHQWLYLNTLDSMSRVKRLVAFYVKEHNSRLPHSAFKGQTPDEVFFGTGDQVPIELQQARKTAQQERINKNRSLSCSVCEK